MLIAGLISLGRCYRNDRAVSFQVSISLDMARLFLSLLITSRDNTSDRSSTKGVINVRSDFDVRHGGGGLRLNLLVIVLSRPMHRRARTRTRMYTSGCMYAAYAESPTQRLSAQCGRMSDE